MSPRPASAAAAEVGLEPGARQGLRRGAAPGYLSLVPAWTYAVIDGNRGPVARVDSWTPERIVAAMHAWLERYGHPPRSYEWAPSTGRAAGLLPDHTSPWELQYPRWPSTGTVAARFDSWCNGLRAAGLPARIPEHELPRAERVLAARRLAGGGMSASAVADLLGVGRSTVIGYLRGGTCPACGGPLVCGAVCGACAPRRAPAATREEVLHALRAWAEEHGCAPRQHDWGWRAGSASPWVSEFPRWPSASSVRTHFSSWNAALHLAGVPLRRRSDWTSEEIFEAIRRWTADHGSAPTYADFRQAPDRLRVPDPKTVADRFGGWRAALAAADNRSRRPAERAVTPVTTSRSSNASVSSPRLDDLDAPARSGRI